MKISKKIKSVLKIIVCLSLSFALMSALTLSIFAVDYKEYSNYYSYTYDPDEHFDGSGYVFSKCPTYAFNLFAVGNGRLSGGLDEKAHLEVTSVQRYNGQIIQINFTILDDYHYIETIDYTTSNTRKEYKTNKKSANFAPIYASYHESKTYGYTIDWKYVSIPNGIVEAGEQFSYYDYFGNERTITFNGKGGIFGGASRNRFEDLPTAEYPDIDDYIPDITDEKYQIKPISDYLPEMPDSLDILDWIKYLASLFPSIFSWLWDNLSGIVTYLIDLIKGFIAFVSDFFKSFFENLKNVFISLFDTSEVDISGRIDEVKEYVFIKFPILSTLSGLYSDIETMLSSFERTAPVITFPTSKVFGGEDVTVSLEFLRPVTVVTDVIIISACYILTLVYSIRALPNIIGGIGSGSAELANSFKSSPVSDHDNQSRFGRFKDFEM